jgi:hypothetical protein
MANCVDTGALAAGAKALAPVKAISARAAESFMVSIYILFIAATKQEGSLTTAVIIIV